KRAFARKYSLFDRIRYYMPDRTVKIAFNKLVNNLKGITIPLSLLSQFMPGQYRKIRNGLLVNDPEELLRDKIIDVIADYSYAAGNG
ncbi:MAG: class II D-tagatose-bisphosphate aldolase, non-catalytic subunit, partial [Spirochaetes bacterium]|nr:class II D-tagatose-bisphosphate aldolase, non-catalytic subunit [Spirochaetota bacterium]